MNAANRASQPAAMGDVSKDNVSPANPAAQSATHASEPASDLLASLTGTETGREAAVGHRTRRVVLSSLGVIREQKQSVARVRGLALAAAIVAPLLIAPLIWEATDSFIGGEHLGDVGSQLSLWATVFCCTLLAAVLVAGWLKRRS